MSVLEEETCNISSCTVRGEKVFISDYSNGDSLEFCDAEY